MREKFQRFMIGRYGVDEFSRTLSGMALGCLVIAMFAGLLPILSIFYWAGLGLIVYSWYRMFSRNVSKRYEENQKFLNFRYRMVAKKNSWKKRWAQRGAYRFYKCPDCKQQVRVPKGRGKICITCPKCRREFIKRT